jgi:hypothetical protein
VINACLRVALLARSRDSASSKIYYPLRPLHIYVAPQHLVLLLFIGLGLPAFSVPLGQGLCNILYSDFGESLLRG